jgi:hypothetical protein
MIAGVASIWITSLEWLNTYQENVGGGEGGNRKRGGGIEIGERERGEGKYS